MPLRGIIRSSQGLPSKRTAGCLSEIWEEPLIGIKILFCGCGLKCFSLLRGTNPKTKHLSPFIFLFLAQCSKLRYHRSSCCAHLRLNTQRGTKTAFLTPQKCNEQLVLFIWVPLPSGIRSSVQLVLFKCLWKPVASCWKLNEPPPPAPHALRHWGA